MSRTNRVLLAAAASATLLALAAFAPSDSRVRADDPVADAMKSLAENRAGALITLKFVLKGMGDADMEMEIEAPGVMIEKTGLVLVANTYLGGFMSRFGGGPTPTPTDIKVLVGDDTQGVEAKMIAKDGELDLAWIQINEPAADGYSFISFDHAANPEIGDAIFGVRRMGKFFDRATLVSESRICGTTKKPRKLYFDTTGNAISMGHPVYDATGTVVGVGTMVMPDQDEMEGLRGMFSAQEDFRTGMILSAEEVVKATARAKEVAASGKSPDEAPADAKPEGAAEMEP